MSKRSWRNCWVWLVLLIMATTAQGDEVKASRPFKKLPDISPQVVAERAAIAARAKGAAPRATDEANHPLLPAVAWAQRGMVEIEKIDDYSATMTKRERIGGKLMEREQMYLKVRHKPFSVYMYFLRPTNIKGQEVIYVSGEGGGGGKMWAHTVGFQDALVGTLSLSPTGMLAMRNQRYPITEAGVLNLTRRLIEVAQYDMQFSECDVKFIKGAKINGRPCTCIQAVHPEPRKEFLFHLARIFVDDELNIPIRYEAHAWPTEPGGEPELLEEYTYTKISINNGFTDLDFDVKNKDYKFR